MLYSLICFVNHYNFRTYALDLGIYTRAVYDYAHFHFNYCEIFKPQSENILGDHFDLTLMFFSPLYWVFGNVTLLVVQIVAIHFGAFGFYKLAQSNNLSKKIALWVSVVFLSSFGVFSAVAFDYHSNVVAACFLPWFVLFFKQEKYLKSTIIFVLILVAKENMALWLFFICTALLFMEKGKSKRKAAIIFSFFSLLYFYVIIFFIMPALSLCKSYNHFEFHALGNSFKEVFFTIIQHPLQAISLLFENNTLKDGLNYIKTETWLFWLISGGFLIFYRPIFLWMLIPIMMQKMYHDDYVKWSISGQYNIEFAPLAAWCLIEVVKSIKNDRKQIWVTSVTAILCFTATIRLCDNTVSFVDKARIRFYQKSHYQSDFNIKEVYAVMNKIPKDAIVSAEGMFVPHLIDRKTVYLYPIVKNAQYILLSDDIHSYPLDIKNMLKQIDSLCLSPKWHHSPLNNHLYLFEIIEKH
ncbi:MAG: DUF2079 domain-containing protein [Bacteroidia bacterium]